MRFLLSAFRWRYFAIASLQVCSVLFDIHAGGGERKIHTVGLHDVHNVQVQVVLHLLDPGASEPVLSDRAMDMDADLYEYYTATLERAFASDEVKNCRFLPDSAFAAEMAQNQDFIDLSRRIAGVIFEQMQH